jgi:tetratricopeptide (TPR) repeat protein
MAEVRSALAQLLRAADEDSRAALTAALEGADLAAARIEAKNNPDSAEAVATVLGMLLVQDAEAADLVDAAKAAAQRAPRDGSGNEAVLIAAQVLWKHGEQPQLAEPYYRRVRRSDPAHPDVLGFYRELFAGDAKTTQLIQVLVQARRASKDPELRFTLAEEVATLAEQRLGSGDRAIEMWRSVIREDGHDPRASEALVRLYRAGGKWTALVDLLKDELERLGAGDDVKEQRISTLLEIAGLYRDKLRLDTMALATLQRILEVDPTHEESLDALADTYAKAGRHADLLGVYDKRIAAASAEGDTARECELLRKMATMWVEQLGNPQRALEPLGRVLALSPKDKDARALLARIHEERRDFRALIALRREELEDLEGEEALAARIDLARLAEDRLGDRREAIEAWNDVLTHHGDDDRALAALARLYERESRWAHAAEILHRKLRTCDRDQAIALLQHLGGLYGDRLQNRTSAIGVWTEVLRLSPGHDKATRRLRDAYVADRRWDELTALYEQQNRLADLVEVLQSAADRIADIEERVQLYRRVAGLCNERLGQPERALKALERTLAIQPDNLDVARELLPIYREQSNWARLMSTYEVLLAAASEDDERLELLASMREVAEDRLHSHALTLQLASKAYHLRPEDEGLREQLEQAAERADGWDELTTIFEGRIDAAGVEDEERLVLLEKLALIARDRLFKPDDAQRYYRRIVELQPTNSEAMAALEDIYSSTRRWDDLSEVYRKRLEVTDDVDARLATLRGLAKLQEDQLADLEAAAECYRTILTLSENDAASLDALTRIYRNRGHWADLAAVLERKLELSSSDTARIPLIFELAQLHATRLQDSDKAVAGFLAVLELDGTHADTVAALEELRQADPSTSLAVMRGLLPFYKRTENRPKEAEAMEVIVAAEDDETTRFEQLTTLAGIYERMDERREDALRIRDQLFRADPSQWEARQVLARLGGELGRMQDVSDAYEAALADIAQEAEAAEAEGRTLPRERATLRRDLLLEHAVILRDQLGERSRAEEAFGVVLSHDETHQGAYESLEALLRERDAHEDLVALYRRRVDVTFNQREQKELLSRIIELSRNVLGDRRTAVATAEELLDLIPDDLGTIGLLAEMYGEGTETDDYFKLEETLGRHAELVDEPAEARELRVRQASLRMQYLGDAFGAVDLLGQVLGDDPDHEEARRLLEELLAISEVQLQACALLEPLYVRLGDHTGRIRVAGVRREQAESVGAKDDAIGYLMQIARVYETDLGDPATAMAYVREAYLMDPTRFDTRQDIERLGLGLGRFAELSEVWQAALAHERVVDSALRIDLTTRHARLLDQHLRDQEGAREAYTQLLALDPPDATLAHEAVSKLCRLHLEAGDGVALVEAKRQLLRFVDTAAQQVEVRLEIAEVQLELRDRVGAALTYSEVLDRQPANAVALDALERLFTEEEEWARLVEVIEHRIGVTTEARAKAALWRQFGELQRDKLDEPTRAIASFQSVLDLKVGREETTYALQSLTDLHESLEHWPDVEECLRRLTTIAQTEEIRVGLLTRTAIVVGKKLGRGSDALDLLKRVLDLAPTDARARSEVAGYLEADATRDRAIRILTPLYEAEQNWPALVELEELQARKQPSGRRRLQALLKVADTQEAKLEDPDKAFGVLCEAMVEAADQPELESILEKVERLGAEEARSEALLAAYSQTVDHILDSGLQKRVLRSQGQVALERLGQLDVARRAYERVLDLSPDAGEAADALEQIYLRQDDYQPLADLLVSRADRAEADARDAALTRAAQIQRDHLDNAEEAIRLYERLSPDAMATAEIQDVLEPLYEQTERWRELAAHLNRKLSRQGGVEAVQTHLRLGRLYGGRLEDPETGIHHLSAALKLDPDQAVATEELDRYLEDPVMRTRVAELLEPVFAAVADWKRLIQIQEIRLADAEDDGSRMRILMRIAQIEEEQLEDLDRAMASYERLFKEQPTSRRVRDQLSRLSGVLGQTERYAALLTEYVQGEGADDNTDEMLLVVREAAELWAGMLRKPEQAVPLLQRMREANPEDRQVFSALETTLTHAEMWRELGALYWSEVDGALEEERQIEVLRKLATLAQEMLEDPDEAARAYRRMLDVRPSYELARARLEQIYADNDRHRDLLDLLRERLDQSHDPQVRAEVALRIAALQDGALEEPDAAVDTIEMLLADTPDDADAVVLLEQIAQRRRELRARILDTLRPIYERAGNVRRMVEVDEWRLSQTEDPIARHELYRGMANLLVASPDTAETAFRTLCRALAEPGPVDTLEDLDREVEHMAETLDLRGALAEALVSAADAEGLQSDEDRRLSLMVRGATLLGEHGAVERAVETLRAALGLREDHPEALARLDDALTALGYHEELAGVLGTRASVAEDDTERVELLRRLARLYEEVLVRPEYAESAWKGLLEVEPGDKEALARLSRVYEASGSTRELVDVLERQVEASLDDQERRDLRMQLANLQRETLKDRAAEIDVLRALLMDAPADDDAMAALARALEAEGRHAEAADVVSERATLTQNDERRASLMLDVARMYAGPLEDQAGALERYEQVLAIMPNQDGALTDLVALAKGPDTFETAGALVAEPLEQAGRLGELADVLEARAQCSQDPTEQVEALQKLVRLRVERLDDLPGALSGANALLDVVEGEEALADALDQGGRLAVQLGQGGEHLDRLAARASDEDLDPDARVATAMYAANLGEEVLGDPGRALGLLSPLVASGLANLDVCLRVERLGRSVDDTAAVSAALVEGARLAGDASQQSELFVRLGDVRRESADTEGALEAYREAFDIDAPSAAVRGMEALLDAGSDAPAVALLDALEQAYLASGDKAGQARVTALRLQAADEADQPRLLEQLATQREEGGGSAEEALDAWGRLLVHDPDATSVLERMLALTESDTSLVRPAVAKMLDAVEAAQRREHVPVAVCVRAARLQLEALRDPAAAMETVGVVLEDQPDMPEALDLLIASSRAAGEATVLHDALTRNAALQSDPSTAVELWNEAATVAQSALANPELAVEDLEQLIAVDENDTRAWQTLLSLRGAAGEPEALADALGRRAGITPDADERRELRYRLANLLVDKLERADDAVGVYQDMLSDQPDDAGAMAELEVLLRRLERWQDVRDVLERKLEVAEGNDRVAVLEDLAQVAEHRLEDPSDAAERYQQILEERPGYEPAETALERLLVAEERWSELSEMLENRMHRCRDAGDLEGYRTVTSKLATLLATELAYPERAKELLDALLEEDPSYVPALLGKAAVYEAMGEEGAMQLTLRRAAELDPQGADGAALHLRLAGLERDTEARQQHLERALALDPANLDAGQALLDLYRDAELWDKLAYALELVGGRTDNPQTRRTLVLERVDVMLHRMQDADGALRVLHGLYNEVQDDVGINRRIADALYSAERFDDAANMYGWLVQVGRQAKRNKALAHDLTRLARIQLASPEPNGAKEQLMEAYRIDTTNVETLMVLGELHEQESDWRDALKIYRTMLLQNADQSGLLRRGDIYVNLARAHVALDEKPKARAMLRRGLEEDGEHPELTGQLEALED